MILMRHIKIGIFIAGVIGALLMTAILGFLKAAGITEINMESALGHLLAPHRETGFMAIGLVFHLFAGGVFALFYSLFIKFLRIKAWTLGMAIGIAHWVLGGIVMGQLCSSHPAMQGAMPGGDQFHTLMGLGTLFALLLVHVLYGGLVGFAILPPKDELDSEEIIDEEIDHPGSTTLEKRVA